MGNDSEKDLKAEITVYSLANSPSRFPNIQEASGNV